MLTELKREAYEANMALSHHRLITLTFGNASAIDRARGIFAIKPSGVDYATLRPNQMVLIDLAGKRVDGRLAPSSDTPTHRRLFLAYKEVSGVVHTHSLYATAFAQAGRSIPILGTTHADFFNGDIPVTRALTDAEIDSEYEWETGNVIVERLAVDEFDPLACPGVLVHRHGPFAWGASVAQAVESAVAMERIAQLALMSLQLAPNLKRVGAALRNRHYNRKHGDQAYYGQRIDRSQ